MSNTYLEYSTEMKIPKGKMDVAKRIIADAAKNDPELDTGFLEIQEDRETIWFRNNYEWDNLEDAVEPMARALVEGMESDEPFYFEYAFTCEKPVLGQFGGGAFVVMRGFDTFWINPEELAHAWIKARKEELKLKTDGSTEKEWLDRSLRGGSWFSYPKNCRLAERNGGISDLRGNNYGFRVVRTVNPLLVEEAT